MSQDIATIRVTRYRPEKDSKPYFQEYKVPYRQDMVVLDALNYIKAEIDGSLTYRWSCRMGVCGSCGANIDGEPKLTCASFLHDFKGRTITVEPMTNFPVDQAVDNSRERDRSRTGRVQAVSPGTRTVQPVLIMHQLHALLRSMPHIRTQREIPRTSRNRPRLPVH